MALTITDLLNAMQNVNKTESTLQNNKDTWSRIGNKDKFVELELEGSALSEFLKEWANDNPYSNIA